MPLLREAIIFILLFILIDFDVVSLVGSIRFRFIVVLIRLHFLSRPFLVVYFWRVFIPILDVMFIDISHSVSFITKFWLFKPKLMNLWNETRSFFDADLDLMPTRQSQFGIVKAVTSPYSHLLFASGLVDMMNDIWIILCTLNGLIVNFSICSDHFHLSGEAFF